MKKFIAGAVFGAILASTVTAYGATTLIGKKIQGETDVIVDGTKLDTAIIVDGKSYAPLRSIGSAAGYEVGFTSDKQITLTSSVIEDTTTPSTPTISTETTTTTTTTDSTPVNGGGSSTMTLEGLNGNINITESDIQGTKSLIGVTSQTDPDYQRLVNYLKELEAKLEDLKKQKAELEAQ